MQARNHPSRQFHQFNVPISTFDFFLNSTCKFRGKVRPSCRISWILQFKYHLDISKRLQYIFIWLLYRLTRRAPETRLYVMYAKLQFCSQPLETWERGVTCQESLGTSAWQVNDFQSVSWNKLKQIKSTLDYKQFVIFSIHAWVPIVNLINYNSPKVTSYILEL